MTTFLSLCIAVLVLAVLLVAFVAFVASEKRNLRLAEWAEQTHTRTMALADRLMLMSTNHAETLATLARAQFDQSDQFLGALAGDRRQLITAVLSRDADPRAAQRFGLVESDLTRTENGETDRDRFIRAMTGESARNEAEFRDPSTGEPMTPVGMG